MWIGFMYILLHFVSADQCVVDRVRGWVCRHRALSLEQPWDRPKRKRRDIGSSVTELANLGIFQAKYLFFMYLGLHDSRLGHWEAPCKHHQCPRFDTAWSRLGSPSPIFTDDYISGLPATSAKRAIYEQHRVECGEHCSLIYACSIGDFDQVQKLLTTQ